MPVVSRHEGIYLVGAPGSGKSVVGRALATELGTQFVDLDDYIERQAGRDIAGIFASEREAGFRQHEKYALQKLMAQDKKIVVATGGGIVLDSDNRKLLANAITIFIDVDEDILWSRIEKDLSSRPLFHGDNPRGILADIMRQRLPLYRQLASYTVKSDTESSVAGLTREICSKLASDA